LNTEILFVTNSINNISENKDKQAWDELCKAAFPVGGWGKTIFKTTQQAGAWVELGKITFIL
jgi:hypothetical protein